MQKIRVPHESNPKRLKMAHVTKLNCNGRPLFGPAIPRQKPTCGPLYELETAIELDRRLKQKYRSYERAAARLAMDGERDAARVLSRAADRVRLLRSMATERAAGLASGPEA